MENLHQAGPGAMLILSLLIPQVTAQTPTGASGTPPAGASAASSPNPSGAAGGGGDCSYDGSLGEYLDCQKARFSTTTLVAVGLGVIFGIFLLAGGVVWWVKQRRQGSGSGGVEVGVTGSRQGGRGGKVSRARARDAQRGEASEGEDESESEDEKRDVKKAVLRYQLKSWTQAQAQGSIQGHGGRLGQQQPRIEDVEESSDDSDDDDSSDDEVPRKAAQGGRGMPPAQQGALAKGPHPPGSLATPKTRAGANRQAAKVERGDSSHSDSDSSDGEDDDSGDSNDSDFDSEGESRRPKTKKIAQVKAKEAAGAVQKPIPALSLPPPLANHGSPVSATPARGLITTNPSPLPRHLNPHSRVSMAPPLPPPSFAPPLPPAQTASRVPIAGMRASAYNLRPSVHHHPGPPSYSSSAPTVPSGQTKPLSIRKSSAPTLTAGVSGSRPVSRASTRGTGAVQAAPPMPNPATGRRPSEGPMGEVRRPSHTGSAAARASVAASAGQGRHLTGVGRRPSDRGNLI